MITTKFELIHSGITCHVKGSSGMDEKERKKFNKVYKSFIEGLGKEERCVQCNCRIIEKDGTPDHSECTKDPPCCRSSQTCKCTGVAGHMYQDHINVNMAEVFLVRICKSCNSQGNSQGNSEDRCVKLGSVYAMRLGKIVSDYGGRLTVLDKTK